jgi:hypothetical protein
MTAELDVTEETIRLRRGAGPDNQSTVAGLESRLNDCYYERDSLRDHLADLRDQIADDPDPHGEDLLAEVASAAEEYTKAAEAAEAARAWRDQSIRAAVAYGHNRTDVAKLSGISRERLYQIL